MIKVEVVKLNNEVHKYSDWGEAESLEIEDAMHKIQDWKRRFSKIKERCYSIQRNVSTFSLDRTVLDRCNEKFPS